MSTTEMNPELSVRSRYSLVVSKREPKLCCAVGDDQRYLSVISKECLATVALVNVIRSFASMFVVK